jgi:alcohol dehydrogenase class IV
MMMKSLYYKFRAFAVTWLLRLLPRNAPVVYKGINSALVLCEQVSILGFTRVIIVTDNFLGSSGILDHRKSRLNETNVEFGSTTAYYPTPPSIRYRKVRRCCGQKTARQ